MYLTFHMIALTGTVLLAISLVSALIHRPLCSISLDNDRLSAAIVVISVSWPASLGIWGILSVTTFPGDIPIFGSVLFAAILGAFRWIAVLILKGSLVIFNNLTLSKIREHQFFWLDIGGVVLPLLIYAYVVIGLSKYSHGSGDYRNDQ